MIHDKSSNFGSPLDIATLNNSTKNFTVDIDRLVASGAVDAKGHALNPDAGMADQMKFKVFTEDGITGATTNISIEVLSDDDSAFGSATTVATIPVGIPGAGGFAAGTVFHEGWSLPEGVNERYIRLRVRNSVAAAVGAGATISVSTILG